MMMEQKWPIRVIVTDCDIRRISLDQKPGNLESLLDHLKVKLALPYDFTLQFEDPLFNNALCNLTDVSELPDRATLKIISLESFSSVSSTLSSPRTSDTDILYTSEEKSPMMRPDPWPSAFDIPDFSVDVNFRLRQGDLACMQEGIRMDVSRDMKHVILERLAEAMYKYTAYPTEEHCQEVAAALIAKHPCLKEAGSPTGYCGWKNSIKFKMGNFRTKMRRSGMADVTVNGNKRKRDFPEGAPSCSNIKRAKRSETNFLPNFPDGENADSLESVRRQLENEAKKRLPDSADVKKMMDKTFALRRKEVVEEQPPVKRMMERWPVLFTESQVFAEFYRIGSKNLKKDFYEALDHHTARLIDLFKSRKGAVGQSLDHLLQSINTQTDITTTRTAVLQCLPLYLGDNSSEFFLSCSDSDTAQDFSQVPVGVLRVMTDDTPPVINSIAIILEGNIVMDEIPTTSLGLCLLFGLIYALHLDYPKGMKNTFEFIQKTLLNLGQQKLSPKLQTLKNALLS
ncbi:sterile alpha motif domain-containing protein 3-like [Seriola aureovittata]|uniref:sterile alpha motif domain-containing protein 3-like n=1 Tax=Seriola aureovittata TaxID=2871759 RepID=UPI0024BF0480|nr:sterile alpha motif domain-containing protein 3-like [Seriola aureovittata]